MKRYILLLLFCLAAGSYAHAADKFKCKPLSIAVSHTGGVYFAEIVYDEVLPGGVLSVAPDIVTMQNPEYDNKYVQSVVFVSKSQFYITFKMRPKRERIDGTIRFSFYFKDRETNNVNGFICTLPYSYSEVTSLIPGVISAPEEEYKYGESPSRITSLMPAMTGASRSVTYKWQKRESTGQWEDMPGCTNIDCYPNKVGYTSTYYQRVANDGYETQYSNVVEVRAAMNAGIIGLEYTDVSSQLLLTDVRTPSVEASRCSWESSTDLDRWTALSGTGYTRSLSKPGTTTHYRRITTSLDGEDKSYSNTVTYNLASPVYITAKTATNAQGTSYVKDHTYYDGLGRPCQTVNVGASPKGEDIVSLAVYDGKGREADSYLPFTVANGGGAFARNAIYKQDQFYKTKFGSTTTLYPYTHNEYDSSPLDRVVKTTRPGAEYRQGEGRGIDQAYGLNGEGEVLRIVIGEAQDRTITVDGTYPAAALQKTVVTNEDGAVSQTFTDPEGRILLSRQMISEGNYADTYFIYDSHNRLAWAISPEGSQALAQGVSYAIDSELANKYCFRYIYDGSGNVKARHIPGRAAEYVTYDAAGRIETMQTGAMREQGAGLAYDYDPIGRLTRVKMKLMSHTSTPGNFMTSSFAIDSLPLVINPNPDPGIDDPYFPPIVIDPRPPIIIDPIDPGIPADPDPGIPYNPGSSELHDTQRYTYDVYHPLSMSFTGHEFVPVP
ncbi:DUF6443 domain-containing protein, partial [uncultured Alistipes sp.]